jgi:hypothetical protein
MLFVYSFSTLYLTASIHLFFIAISYRSILVTGVLSFLLSFFYFVNDVEKFLQQEKTL